MILHKFSSSPYASNTVVDSLSRIEAADGILLTLDSVYCGSHDILDSLLSITPNVYVLKDDTDARGIKIDDKRLKQIDYNDFVTLVTEYDSVIAWD